MSLKSIGYRIAEQQLLPGYLNDTLTTIRLWRKRRQTYIEAQQDWPENQNDGVEAYRLAKIKAITEIIELLESDARQMNRRLAL